MSALTIGFLGLGAVIVLLALRVPVAVALGLVPLVGMAIVRGPEAALGILGSTPFDFTAHWTLSAVPMFLLMGALAYHSNLTASLYTAGRVWLGRLPGGLAVATNFACAGFAAASGSSMATAAAMARIAVPEMLRLRYEPGLATAVVAAGGTLGALIPPSILMVIYGWLTGQSVGKLLIAGAVPGLLTAIVYAAMILTRCAFNPRIAPSYDKAISWPERWRALAHVWPLPLLVLGVVGGIYGGIVTPTEAGAFGAILTLIIGLARGELGWASLKESIVEALRGTATIFFIAIGAILLTRFLGFCGVPAFLATTITGWGTDPLILVLATTIIYLILGMFLDPLGILLLTLPVLLPLFEAVRVDMIWLGIILIKYIEIGLLTPPVGLNVFVVKSVVGDAVELSTIFRGVFWFLGAEVVIMTILIAFPEVTLTLPNLMGY